MAVPGLDPERRYDVRVLDVAGGPRVLQRTASPWLTNGSLQLSGQVLRTVGLALPVLQPEQALLLELRPA